MNGEKMHVYFRCKTAFYYISTLILLFELIRSFTTRSELTYENLTINKILKDKLMIHLVCAFV